MSKFAFAIIENWQPSDDPSDKSVYAKPKQKETIAHIRPLDIQANFAHYIRSRYINDGYSMIRNLLTRTLLKLYRWILQLHPASYRDAYCDLMYDIAHQMWHDAVRDRRWSGLFGLMLHLLIDVLQSLVREHTEEQKESLVKLLRIGLLGLITLGISPLLEPVQLLGITPGPILLVLSLWWISNLVNVHHFRIYLIVISLNTLLILLGSLAWQHTLTPLLHSVWISLGISGFLLSAVLLARWLAHSLQLAPFPVTATILALLASYADLDYFTFGMAPIIRMLPLMSVPVLVLWWVLVEQAVWRKNGMLLIWAVTLLMVSSANFYGRHILAGTDHLSLNAVTYSLVSITMLWIASMLPPLPSRYTELSQWSAGQST